MSQNPNFKQLFQNLINCMNEDEVTKVLENNNYANDLKNWIPLGNNRNNAAIVQNTAGNLGACMAELATNAIDAVIQREKNEYEKTHGSIPAEHLTSPQKCLSFILGDNYKSQKELEKYAHEMIKLITTEFEEKNSKRHLTIIDRGCGQKAKNFATTFCSVGSGFQNKAEKSWLHGNYGQGSTSANAISGKMGYKLIVSREDINQPWAFTLIRRSLHDPSVLEYLIVNNGKSVPEFTQDKIELGYRVTRVIQKGDAALLCGSAIKLFNVNFESGFTGIKRTLSSVLVRPALPIKSIEYSFSNERTKATSGRDNRWIYGLGNILDEAVKENKAEIHQATIGLPHLKGEAYVKMYFIRDEVAKGKMLDWLPTGYNERIKRVFHINNGQVQHNDTVQRIGKFFPKAKENVFVEIDLSNIDPILAKAYLWKADRTSCQTSNEYFIEYDEILNDYIKNCEVLRDWAIVCKNDEMASLKINPSGTQNAHTRELLALCEMRQSKNYKANKKLIQSEGNMPSTHAQGNLYLVKNDVVNEDITEVEGKDIPTIFSNENSSKENMKKSSVNKMSSTFKTNLKKGSIATKDSNSKVSLKKAVVNKGSKEEKNLDLNKVNLVVSQTSDGFIKCQFNPAKEIKDELKVGDVVTIELELNTKKDGIVTTLQSVVYFEIIEELEEVAPKKNKVVSSDMINKCYGTRDGKKYNGQPTATLPSEPEKFNFDAGCYVIADGEKLNIVINLDNPGFVLKIDKMKDNEKSNFLMHWESQLFMNVVARYKNWLGSDKTKALEDTVEKLNKENVDFNEFALNSATYCGHQIEKMMNHASKHLDKISKVA
jgi:hypothetical protein